jgi:hypothetical protein
MKNSHEYSSRKKVSIHPFSFQTVWSATNAPFSPGSSQKRFSPVLNGTFIPNWWLQPVLKDHLVRIGGSNQD